MFCFSEEVAYGPFTITIFLNGCEHAEYITAQYHMIPQPAMSQTISRLEKELGKPLFDRQKNKLTLTREGQAFLNSVSASMSELDNAVQAMHSDSDTLGGELTLLVQQQRSRIVDCIVSFRKRYPNVSFRIFHTQDRNDLDKYDLCISYKPPYEKYSESKCLITEKLHLMVSATHPLAAKPFVRMEELKEEEFAFLDKTTVCGIIPCTYVIRQGLNLEYIWSVETCIA